MSNLRNHGESNSSINSNSTISVRSSYFHTEISSGKSDGSNFSDNDSSRVSCVDVSPTRRDIKDSSHIRKVNISVQVDRSIIGQEDSLPKERKRWIRPPVVGQASSNDDKRVVLSTSQSRGSSESEDEIKAQISDRNESAMCGGASEVFQNRSDYINEKPMEGGSDQSLPPFNELSDFQRIPTPSSVSSITPRPLEWDSGADVGYFQQYGSMQHNEMEFSSIERIALEQGRVGILVRSDPEGTTSSKKVNSTVLNMIGVPKSESTPINTSEPEKKCKNSKKNPTKYQHLFPEVIIQNIGTQSDSNSEHNYGSENLEAGEASNFTVNKKLSSSLENLSYSKLIDHQSATFPRSQSQLNLFEESNSKHTLTSPLEKGNNPPQSVSSSSITTVVTGSPHKKTKCIQTSNRKNSIGTQSSLIDSREKSDKQQVHKKGGHNDSSTLESIQMSTGDRANSFEYLPGHMYECSKNPSNLDIWEDADGTSLKNDVERGVQILEDFIQGSNANNTLMKKKLIQNVVKRLIHTDYPEDSEPLNIPQRCTTRRSQNRDEVVGESSSENAKVKKSLADNSTSLSGHSSSTWQSSVTESTKSSDRSNIKSFVPKPVYKKSTEDSKSKSTIDGLPDSKSDWKAPVTRTEKLYEHRKKGIHKDDQTDDQLLEFVNSERENQIDWIVKEINHLSNLKILLEKHERLRKNLNRLKKAKQVNEKVLEHDVKPTNHIRAYGFRRRPLHNMEMFKKPSATLTKETKKTNSISGDSWDSHCYETDDRGKLKKSVSTETRKEDIISGIRSTAYTITFDSPPKPKKPERKDNQIIADRQTLAKKSKEFVRETYQLPTLQDHLIVKRPDIVSRAEIRRKTVAELAAIRQLREEQRPVILAAALSCDTGFGGPPPPPLVKRVVSQKEMRQQTEKKYRQTFEVKKKVSEQKLKESLKTNRLMADIYNKRLQLLALKGQTNLSNSLDVISTVY